MVFGLGLVALLLASPLIFSRFYIYLLALILVTGLLATSLNMVLGYGGMYQFHHAVFYGMGAYAFALMLSKTTLSPVFVFVAGPLAAAILSLIMGLICVRLSKLYFGMLQLSLGSLVWAVVFRWYSFTGGDDGIHGVPMPSIYLIYHQLSDFTLIVAGICLCAMYSIINSPFGRVFQAIRDNPERSEAIGVNVRLHQLVGLVIAGFFGGIAGVLFVTVEGSVFPDLMFLDLVTRNTHHVPSRRLVYLSRPNAGRGNHRYSSNHRGRLHRLLDNGPGDRVDGFDLFLAGRRAWLSPGTVSNAGGCGCAGGRVNAAGGRGPKILR